MGEDKSLIYYSKTQTLIGEQKRTLVDKNTGEIIQVDQITKRAYGSKQFWKMYLMDFLMVLGIIDSKQLDVFIYICENTNPSDNRFIGTYDRIAEATKTSRPTIAKILKKLQDNKFIRKEQVGVYRVNPDILMKGNDHKRQILLSYYDDSDWASGEVEADGSISVLRGRMEAIPTVEDQLPGQVSIEQLPGEEV